MRNRFLVYCGLVCALAALTADATPAVADQPTTGGQPAFATSSDVKLSTIRELISAKDYQSAEQLASELTSEKPDILDGWMMLGYTRSLTGKFEESNQAYDMALEYGGDAREVYRLKAYNCRKLGDVQRTRECYESILEVDAESVDILMQYGAFEMSAGNYERAVRCYDTVLRVDAGNVEAIQAVAKAEEKLGNTAQVKYWLEQGLERDPDNTKLLKRISLIYLNEQNYQLTIHYLDRLLEIDPGDAAAHRNRGIAYYQKGDKRDAIESFEAVRSSGGSMDGLYGPLADCYRSTGQRTKSLQVIKEGIEEGTQSAWLYSVWGKILEDGKNYDAAISKFSKAVSLQDEPWSGYARKQIARQAQLKKRAEMIAAQGGME